MTNGYDSHHRVWQVKKVHMAVDMYQGFLMATPQTGEAAKHVISHCLRSFTYMGMPKIYKKQNNGPRYTNKASQQFYA